MKASALKKTFIAVASLAFFVLAPLGVRSCLFLEGDWITCRLDTSEGEIQARIYPAKAPLTAANFLRYVDSGLYNGTTFFRVVTADNQPHDKVKIKVVQGGDVDERKCFPPVAHETTKMTSLKHEDGTISMARDKPGTATSSFFICIGRQPELDFGGRRNTDGQGFAAFGRVVAGMDVVRRITKMDLENQRLRSPVVIHSIIRLDKPNQMEGVFGKGYKGEPNDIWEALRLSASRMGLKDFVILFALMALIGWLTWRGFGPGKFAGREKGSANLGWENAGPGLRLMATIFAMALWALIFILLAS